MELKKKKETIKENKKSDYIDPYATHMDFKNKQKKKKKERTEKKGC